MASILISIPPRNIIERQVGCGLYHFFGRLVGRHPFDARYAGTKAEILNHHRTLKEAQRE